MATHNTCCNNPTLAYRSENDREMIKKYCPYANNAPTSFYKNYPSVKEGFCMSCGDSSPNGYWSLGNAYGPKPGAYASCKEGVQQYQKVLALNQPFLSGAAPLVREVRENYCSCTAGCASLPYNGTTQYGFVDQVGSDYPAPCARKYSANRNMPPGI